MKRTLKIGFAHTFSTAESYFIEVLGKRYNVTRDDENPDYLIFGDLNANQSFYVDDHYNWSKYKNPNMITISYSGECVRPPLSKANFSMGYDHLNSPRHYRLPLYAVDMWFAVTEGWTKNYLQVHADNIDHEKNYDNRDFCTFVVSNPRQEIRNSAFHFINEYKNVASGGPYLNNIGGPLPRDKLYYKLNFLDKYRFNICFENGSNPGYVSEKILNAFQVRTMPIYWGSPTVGRDFNVKCFINAADHGNFNKLVDYIRHLDSPSGKKEYLDMMEQPIFKNNIPNEFTNMDNLCDWWETYVEEK